MQRKTKFSNEQLENTPIISVFEFDLLKNGNGIIYGDIEYFNNVLSPKYLPSAIKVYCIYPDIDLFEFFNKIIPNSYFLWDTNEYQYSKKQW